MSAVNQTLSVLYVGDDVALLKSTKRYLEHNGDFRVDTVSSGREGLKKLEMGSYDAIVCDSMMAEPDGISFLSALQTVNNDIPTILFSKNDSETITIKSQNASVDYYLAKGNRPDKQSEQLKLLIIHAAEAKRTSKAVYDHWYQLEHVVNALPEAIFAIDTQGRITAWNNALKEMLGIPASAMLGKGDYAYSIPFYGEKRPLLIDAALNNTIEIPDNYQNLSYRGDRIRAETYLPVQQGSEDVYLSVVALPLRDAKGNIIGALETIRDISDLKKTEIELKAGEEQYKSILEEQTEFVCRFTPDWKYSYVNEAFCRYFGMNREDLIGKTFKPLMPEGEQKKIGNHFQALTPEHPSVSFRERTLGPQGEERWQHWNTQAFFTSGGEIREYQSVGRDVTEIVRSEKELEAIQRELQIEKERYRTILEEQTEFVCRFTPDWKYSYVNEAFCRYFGMNREDLIGKMFKPLMPEGEKKKVGNQFQALTPDHPNISFRERTLGPGGEERWQHWNTRAFFDENGVVLEYQSVGRDVTTIVKGEDALALSEQTYRTIFENTGSASLIFETDTTISLVNTEFEHLTGFPREEVEGKKSWTEFIAPDDLGMLLGYNKRRILDPEDAPDMYEFRILDRNNNLKHVAMTIGTLPERGRVIASLVDVTENKEMQNALRVAHNKLRLLTGITRHDIINKINALFFLIDDVRNENQVPHLDKTLETLENLVDDIYQEIDFTRTYEELGSNEPQWQKCESIVADLDVPSGLSLNSSLDGIEVYADLMLKKVFINLIDNSVRHGGDVTAVQLHYVKTDDALILIYEDNGVGVPLEMKEKIFEQNVGKNTGLGLFLAHEILAITEITIKETGVAGHGARFEITIPREKFRITT